MKKVHLEQQSMSTSDLRQEQNANLAPKGPFDTISFQCEDGRTVACSGTKTGYLEEGNIRYGVKCDGVNYPCSGSNPFTSGFDCSHLTDLPLDEEACCNKFPDDFCEYMDENVRYSGTCRTQKNSSNLKCY